MKGGRPLRVFMLADMHSDWYPRNAYKLLKRHSGVEFTDAPSQSDLIWVFSYYERKDCLLRGGRLARLARILPLTKRGNLGETPVITTIHHLDPQKEKVFREDLRVVRAVTDFVHFFSTINQANIRRFLPCPQFHMPYWIDLAQFAEVAAEEKAKIRRSLGIPDGRLVIGSFQRDTEADLVTPKLAKGPDIFCDVLEALDRKRICVLLAGPRREYIQIRLEAAGIMVRVAGRVEFDQMNRLYQALDLYLVTSRHEGGPQAILECMSARVPVLTTMVGVADLLNPRVVCGDPGEFVSKIEGGYSQEFLDEHHERVQRYDVKRVANFVELTLRTLTQAFGGPRREDLLRRPQLVLQSFD